LSDYFILTINKDSGDIVSAKRDDIIIREQKKQVAPLRGRRINNAEPTFTDEKIEIYPYQVPTYYCAQLNSVYCVDVTARNLYLYKDRKWGFKKHLL